MRTALLIFFFLLSWSAVQAARVYTLEVDSHVMGKTLKNVVIVPEAAQESSRRFPVLYLLHGADGAFDDWIRKVPEIKVYADHYEMIIVCPDGGHNSWYFDSPSDPSMQYETYVTEELVPQLDKFYPTLAEKRGRAIAGLSMGGHGALYLSIRHQDLFGAAGSMSGGLDFTPFTDSWDIAKRLGPYDKFPDLWEKNTVINMTALLKNSDLKLIIDCGIKDFFFDGNQRMHEKLMAEDIPHDYITRPGDHDWDYWTRAIEFHILFFHKFFNDPVKKTE